MNKILGILLFVIIVVSTASVTFAYDPGVTGDDNSDDTTFLAAGADDEALYADVLSKIDAYNDLSKDMKDYPDDVAYFGNLTKAWDEYTIALETYNPDDPNLPTLKTLLSNKITDYYLTLDEIEANLIIAKQKQNDFNDAKLAKIESLDDYINNLNIDFSEYLGAWFKYDTSIDVDIWSNQFDVAIQEYNDSCAIIFAKYNTAYGLYESYLGVLAGVNTELEANPDPNFDSTKLENAWEAYVLAWKDFAIAANIVDDSFDIQELLGELKAVIDNYRSEATIVKNNNAVNTTKAHYDKVLAGVLEDLSGDPLPDYNFTALRNAWRNYVLALKVVDDSVNVRAMLNELRTSISTYRSEATVVKNNNAVNTTKAHYDEVLAGVLENLVGKDPLPGYNFTNLRNAWRNYVLALKVVDDSVNVRAMLNELRTSISTYRSDATEALRKINLYPDLIQAKDAYDALLNYVESNLEEFKTEADFAELEALWKTYVELLDKFDGNSELATFRIAALNAQILAYLGSFEEFELSDNGLTIVQGDEIETFAGNGWGNTPFKHWDGEQANGKVKTVYDANGIKVWITTASDDTWKVHVTTSADVKISKLSFIIAYHYAPDDGREDIYYRLITIYITGEDSLSFNITNKTGTGPGSINRVKFGLLAYYIFESDDFTGINEDLPPLDSLEFNGPNREGLTKLENPNFNGPNREGVDKLENPDNIKYGEPPVPVYPPFKFEGPNTVVTSGFDVPEPVVPVELEDPIDPILPQEPEDPEIPDDVTTPPNVGGDTPQGPADTEGGEVVDEGTEDVVGHAGSMKNTGLPVGLIVALLMSVLVAIRIKK